MSREDNSNFVPPHAVNKKEAEFSKNKNNTINKSDFTPK